MIQTPKSSPSTATLRATASPYKDTVLDRLATVANVAQFVSFAPQLSQRFARIRGYPPNYSFPSTEAAIEALLQSSPDGSVNVRSFSPTQQKSQEFHYGLRCIDDVMQHIRRLATSDLFTIVNETIDVNDGGVSGVVLGDVVEFAPGDTPRCVEKPGTASFPLDLGVRLLETVYHFRPLIEYPPDARVEFSIHPIRRGIRYDHTIIWEMERITLVRLSAALIWPNRFSRFIGDKTFGLLVADLIGLPVPRTTIISRTIPPFHFGKSTGTGETWVRTCPLEPMPGRFPTRHGWCDPFWLLAEQDPEGTQVASVLAQEGVEPIYSGAVIADPRGSPIIEGVRGSGDKFMQGQIAPEELPQKVRRTVQKLFGQATAQLGPVRLEWVYDGRTAWAVQLHRGATTTSGRTIFPGEAHLYHRFDVNKGIDALRDLIAKVERTGEGIILVGNIGVTSHLGDLLRRAKIPSRIEPSDLL